MNKDDHKAVSARDLMAVTVFYAINILLFPVTLIGYVIWAGKAARTSRRSGVSATAQGPLSGRWFMHLNRLREIGDRPAHHTDACILHATAAYVDLVSFKVLPICLTSSLPASPARLN